MRVRCDLCFRECVLSDGETGYCGARICQDGAVKCGNYARVTALALDPVEKKPFCHYFPGKRILSLGSYGCNMDCPFCQNDGISKRGESDVAYREMLPDELSELAVSCAPRGNVGVAFTYNEPLVGYEYVRDCARRIKARGLQTALVTNGCIHSEKWTALLTHIDAANIDLKGFSTDCYQRLGGCFADVCENIRIAAGRIHLEITTLIVPGLNDDEEMMREEAAFLASLGGDIPLHVTRFFPRRRMQRVEPAPVKTLERLADVARERLRYVYIGNC